MSEITASDKRRAFGRGTVAFIVSLVILALAGEHLAHGTLAYWAVAAVGILALLVSALNLLPIMVLEIVKDLPKKPPEVSQEAVDVAQHELRELADHYSWSDEELAEEIDRIADKVTEGFTVTNNLGNE